MRTKIFFITLAVDDLERSVAFYRDELGWPTEGIVGQHFHDEVTGADGTIAFFTLDGGLLLGLYERTNLAKEPACHPACPARPSSASESPPHRRQRSTSSSGKPKPPAARSPHPPTCARSASTPATSPIPTVISSRSPGTPTTQQQRRQLDGPPGACLIRCPHISTTATARPTLVNAHRVGVVPTSAQRRLCRPDDCADLAEEPQLIGDDEPADVGTIRGLLQQPRPDPGQIPAGGRDAHRRNFGACRGSVRIPISKIAERSISPTDRIVPTCSRGLRYQTGNPAVRSAQSRGRHNRRSRTRTRRRTVD